LIVLWAVRVCAACASARARGRSSGPHPSSLGDEEFVARVWGAACGVLFPLSQRGAIHALLMPGPGDAEETADGGASPGAAVSAGSVRPRARVVCCVVLCCVDAGRCGLTHRCERVLCQGGMGCDWWCRKCGMCYGGRAGGPRASA
jgi:hypothetical protein